MASGGIVLTVQNDFSFTLSWDSNTQTVRGTANSVFNNEFLSATGGLTTYSILSVTDSTAENSFLNNPPDYVFSSKVYPVSLTKYLTSAYGSFNIPKATFLANANNYNRVDNVSPNNTYVLYIRDYDGSGALDNGQYVFDQVWITSTSVPSTAPAAPTLISAVPNICNNSFDLTWSNVTGEDAYAVWRSTDGVNYTLRGTTAANVTNYTDGGAVTGVTYYYKVASRWSNLYETFSNVISSPLVLSTPILNSATYNTVNVSNDLVFSSSSCLDNLQIERKTGAGAYSVLTTLTPTIGSTYSDTAITLGTTYTYRLRGNYNGTLTSYSNEITVVANLIPPVQTIDVFYTSSTTFTVPAGVTSVSMFCIGGGAGGQAGQLASFGTPGMGGKGGDSSKGTFSVTGGDVATITIGAGGARATSSLAWGGAGGQSSILFSNPAKRIYAAGGNQRTGNNGTTAGGTVYSGGVGGTTYGTTMGAGGGGAGTNGGGTAGGYNVAGVGGSLYGGNGGTNSSKAGKVYGGGGSGGAGTSTATGNYSGAGAQGYAGISYTNPYYSNAPVISSVTTQSLSSQLVTFNTPVVPHNYILIERNVNYAGYVQIGSVASGVTTFLDTNAQPNVVNSFRVRAVNTLTNSVTNYSNVVDNTITFLAPVASSISFDNINHTIQINYSNPNTIESGTTVFYIERKLDTGSFVQYAIQPFNSTFFVDTSITNNIIYTYRIRLLAIGGAYSPYSDELIYSVNVPAPAAVNLTLTQQPCTPVNNLTWNQVFPTGSTGTGYKLYRSVDGNPYTEYVTGTTLFLGYNDFDLTLLSEYDYYVQSFDTFAGETNSTVKSVTSALFPPTLNAVPTLTGITLSWVSNNSCDIGFTLERRTSPSGSWSVLIGSPTLYTGLTYVDTTAVINQPYDYRMTSSSDDYTSTYSNIITSTINVTPPVAPTLDTVSGLTPTTVRVSWTNNQPLNVDESVKTFKVFRENLSGGGYQEVASVGSGTTSTVITETVNGDLRYYVQALSLLAASESNTLILPLYPNSLTVTRVVEDQLNLQLFNTSTNLTAIELFRSTTTGTTYSLYQTLGSGATTYNDTGLNEDGIYFYKFRYRNGTGVTSIYSLPSSGLTYLATPVESSVTQVGLTKLKVDWIDNSTKESNYEIYRNVVGSPQGFQLLTTVGSNVTTYTDTSVSANNDYEYYVRAIKTN